MGKKGLVLLTLLLSTFFIASCNQQSAGEEDGGDAIMNISASRESISQFSSRLAIQKTKKKEEVANAIAINSEKDLLVAFEVKQFDSFQTEKIEGEVKKLIEKAVTTQEVTVSSDKKIFMEIEELLRDWKDKDLTKSELNKKIKSIKDLSEEET